MNRAGYWAPVVCFLIAFLTHGCAGNQATAEQISTQPAEVPVPPPEYRLGFGDEIEIKFFRHVQFNETIVVRPDGRISLAKVGEIYVAGMTPSVLDSVITNSYAEIIRDPDVTIIVRGFGGYQVYVLGEVNKPGSIPVQRSMTVLQAIAAAGGTTPKAKINSVMVLRRENKQQAQAYRLDLSRTLRSQPGMVIEQSEGVFVEPMDVVFVPKTFIGTASDFMTQLYATVLPPLDLYLRALIVRDAIR